MAVFQGGFVRRVPEHKLKSAAVAGLWLIVPAYGCVALSPIIHIYLLYIGLFLFAVCKFSNQKHIFEFLRNTKLFLISYCICCAISNVFGIAIRRSRTKRNCYGSV